MLSDYCEREGRDYSEIEKTVQTRFDYMGKGEQVNEIMDYLHNLADIGIELAHGTVVSLGSRRSLEFMAERVLPA